MKKIGLYYNFETHKTSHVANKVKDAFEKSGKYEIIPVDVNEKMTEEQFMQFEYMILGVATWMDGELPYYWDEFVPAIEDMNLKGKKIAIFGLGDQNNGRENFEDAIGLLGYLVEERGAKLFGFTSTEGYKFERSVGVRDGKFMGLAIDVENQAALTNERVDKWVTQLHKEGF